ncbi:MAG: hypothetical protein Fues2KO_26200 [Fuerstiella sp.]
MDLHNRAEEISEDQATGGRVCHWQDSSPLTVARFFPQVGARFLHHCLDLWPVSFQPRQDAMSEQPEVSFVVGVRGTGRLPQFQATVDSLLAQEECQSEVIVVEQSWEQQFAKIIPGGARYIHTKATSPDMPFNRSWALNVGAREARGRVVVLHDGDYVVPKFFAREVARKVSGEIQSARLPRYIFYFDQETSADIQERRTFNDVTRLEKIVQNNPTPMALTRDAYLRIGGHDESFYGWGGEDLEFLDRARTLRHAEGAFLPIFHMWHEEAPQRASGHRNRTILDERMAVPTAARKSQLAQAAFGMMKPAVKWEVD